MRIVFFGTSAFAVPSLKALALRGDVVAVVTQPDRPAGRGHRLTPTAVKTAALELNLPVLTPARLGGFGEELRSFAPDLLAVASYGKIIPAAVLAIPRLGALNIHPSLLPLYRGATPLQAVLRDGCAETGITIFSMDAGMDTGDILVQEHTPIGERDTFGTLHDRLAAASPALLLRAIDAVAAGTAQRIPQEGLASPEAIARTLTKPLGTADFEVHWEHSAEQLANMIRSLSPAPAARARIGGVRVKRLAAHAEPATLNPKCNPGDVVGFKRDAVLVACGENALAVERVVAPNKPPQTGAVFMRSVH